MRERQQVVSLAAMREPSLLRFYVSREWLNKFNTFAEPGPITNHTFLCSHGGEQSAAGRWVGRDPVQAPALPLCVSPSQVSHPTNTTTSMTWWSFCRRASGSTCIAGRFWGLAGVTTGSTAPSPQTAQLQPHPFQVPVKVTQWLVRTQSACGLCCGKPLNIAFMAEVGGSLEPSLHGARTGHPETTALAWGLPGSSAAPPRADSSPTITQPRPRALWSWVCGICPGKEGPPASCWWMGNSPFLL